jgi:hypothetical protein
LAVGPAVALSRGKEVVSIDLSAEGMEDALFPEHTHGVDEGQASIVDRVEDVKRGTFVRLADRKEEGRGSRYCGEQFVGGL